MRSRSILLTTATALAALLVAACGYPDPTPANGQSASVAATTPTAQVSADDFHEGDAKTPVKFPDGLEYIDLKAGTGQTVPRGSTITAQYTAWLSDGTMFDTSRQSGRDALCAILVNTQSTNGNCTPVIEGWNEGIPGMKVGGRRKLIIPPALGYGSQGQPPTIPANSTLVFTIELVSIVTTATPPPTTPSPT